MKNWKYIEGAKTGNSRVGNELTSYEKAKKSDLEKRLKKEEQLLEDAKKMLRSKLSDDDHIGFQMQKEECEKNVSRLKEEIRKIGNSRTGNKNQDWDVGNIDWDVGNFKGQWYVTKNGQKLVGPFMSMKEAERYLDGHKWELQDKYGNSKTGNEVGNTKVKKTLFKSLATPTTWTPGINGRPIPGAPEFKGTFAKDDAEKWTDQWIKDHGFEVGNKETGNDTPWEYAHRKPKVINDDKTGAEEFFKQLSDDVKEREDKDDADIEKIGNANLETSVEKGKLGLWNWYVHKDGTIVSGGTSSTEANAKEMARKALEKEKVGNSFGNTLLSWSEKALIAKGQYEDAKRPAEKQYIKSYAQKDMQFLKNNISRVKDDAELKDIQKAIDIYQKIGNKVGNSSVSGGTFKSDDGSQKAVIDVNPQSGTARVVWFENDRQNASSDYRSIDLATAAVKRKGLKKVGNFKTGTSQLKPGDKVMSFGKKGTVKEVIGENTDNIYGEPLIKVEFEDGTTKTIGEHYMRKVGNARYTTREDVISHLDTDLYDICKKVPAGSPSFAYVSELQKKGWDISTISKYTKEIGKIIDQYKVGNIKFASDYYDIKQESNGKFYIYVNGGAKTYGPMNSEAEAKAELQRILSQRNRTGNRVIEKESEMSQELKNLLKQANPEWKDKVSFAFSHGFDIDENDFINAIKKDLQNKRTGNAQWDRAYYKQMIDPAKWSEFEKKFEKLIYDQNLERYDMEDRMSLKPELRSDKYKMIERQRKDVEAMINKYRKAGNKTGKSIGNKVSNSAPDDKFAYVMREFDEGKLKTPDGKVVTDPAQAKAIAYSESKKTENGLARARNAMNKKCGNSQVTLWKGNDSVLISEDGTVQYLESNSFETDRDKYGSMQEAIDDLTKKGYRKK